MKAPLDPEFLDHSRKLRKTQTDAEKLLWSALRNRQLLGLKFRRQYLVEPYILDFYCHKYRLGIELDGGQHYTNEGKQRDSTRDTFIAAQGVRILRFSDLDVLANLEAVLQTIVAELSALTPTLSRREREK
ncbi:MAG TPA: endonuclease domain-containing protein [Alphaproteobacteria bacterium]|nr:endonuclease domain-containing protein [Alphaproteobacteria bacterium]